MSKPFTFKQFSISQENAAFKVGTDSVVLGAWADVIHSKSILDIGTGTGLLALMCAQRTPTARILAIEKDEASFIDAQQNFKNSPWNERLQAIHLPLEDYISDTLFDYIICNPPYFLDALLSPDIRKSDARHATKAWFTLLAKRVNDLSTANSTFGCVLPQKEYDLLKQELNKLNWQVIRIKKLLPYPGGDKIRVLAEWKQAKNNIHIEALPHIYVRNEEKEFSTDYKVLTKDFYLKF